MKSKKVKEYFEKIADDFDNIYNNKGSALDRFINRVCRKGMYERVALTIEECGDVGSKSVLDVGCGSGRVALAIAKKGAQVLGIDYSVKMIELANSYLSKCQGKVNARFLYSDFMEDFANDKSFDITLALGVTDYLANPLPLLKKMRDMTREKMIVSYPARFSLQTPLRKIWLYSRQCPVYFYTKGGINRIYQSLEVEGCKIIEMPLAAKIPTDYLVTATI